MASLADSLLFAHLPAADLQPLEAAVQVREFAAGAPIFQEGDPGDGMYVILEGRVHISCLVGANERRPLSRLEPGDFFGEMAILDNHPRSATATAEVATRLAFLPSDRVIRVLEQSPVLGLNLVRQFSARVREFNHTYTREVLQAERLALVGRFARSIVHDFKNPLNIIGISADMAAMESATLAMRVAARTRIRRQVERLSNMINELLEFTRGSGANVILARLDYVSFILPLVDELRAEMEPRGVQVVLENEPPALGVAMDPRRLAHVFYNLLHNACDAMPSGGQVRLRFGVTAEGIVTELQDAGPGIAAEIQSRLFEAFATHGKANGTGLGLSICKRIIEDHRGKITARNAPDGGAVFAFTLPVSVPVTSAA